MREMNDIHRKIWRLTLQSCVKDFGDNYDVSNCINFVPMSGEVNSIVKGNQYNRKMTEYEFDQLVAKMKEFYFSSGECESVEN